MQLTGRAKKTIHNMHFDTLNAWQCKTEEWEHEGREKETDRIERSPRVVKMAFTFHYLRWIVGFSVSHCLPFSGDAESKFSFRQPTGIVLQISLGNEISANPVCMTYNSPIQTQCWWSPIWWSTCWSCHSSQPAWLLILFTKKKKKNNSLSSRNLIYTEHPVYCTDCMDYIIYEVNIDNRF